MVRSHGNRVSDLPEHPSQSAADARAAAMSRDATTRAPRRAAQTSMQGAGGSVSFVALVLASLRHRCAGVGGSHRASKTRKEKGFDREGWPLATDQLGEKEPRQGRGEDAGPEVAAGIDIASKPFDRSKNGKLVRRARPQAGPDPLHPDTR